MLNLALASGSLQLLILITYTCFDSNNADLLLTNMDSINHLSQQNPADPLLETDCKTHESTNFGENESKSENPESLHAASIGFCILSHLDRLSLSGQLPVSKNSSKVNQFETMDRAELRQWEEEELPNTDGSVPQSLEIHLEVPFTVEAHSRTFTALIQLALMLSRSLFNQNVVSPNDLPQSLQNISNTQLCNGKSQFSLTTVLRLLKLNLHRVSYSRVDATLMGIYPILQTLRIFVSELINILLTNLQSNEGASLSKDQILSLLHECWSLLLRGVDVLGLENLSQFCLDMLHQVESFSLPQATSLYLLELTQAASTRQNSSVFVLLGSEDIQKGFFQNEAISYSRKDSLLSALLDQVTMTTIKAIDDVLSDSEKEVKNKTLVNFGADSDYGHLLNLLSMIQQDLFVRVVKTKSEPEKNRYAATIMYMSKLLFTQSNRIINKSVAQCEKVVGTSHHNTIVAVFNEIMHCSILGQILPLHCVMLGYIANQINHITELLPSVVPFLHELDRGYAIVPQLFSNLQQDSSKVETMEIPVSVEIVETEHPMPKNLNEQTFDVSVPGSDFLLVSVSPMCTIRGPDSLHITNFNSKALKKEPFSFTIKSDNQTDSIKVPGSFVHISYTRGTQDSIWVCLFVVYYF